MGAEMTIKLTITTNIATEYTHLHKVLSMYAMIIRKKVSTYSDNTLTPASKCIVTLEIEESPVQEFFIKDLQKIEGLKLSYIE